MANPTGLNIKLDYLQLEPTTFDPDKYPPQPVRAVLDGNKTPTKLVPVLPLTEHDKCIGCIAYNNSDLGVLGRIDCYRLPDCPETIFVRANPANLLRHIEWRLENDK